MIETAGKLGRFGHHPDPATDFCVEVECIEGEHLNNKIGFMNGTPTLDELRERVGRAMEFRVGGDLNAIEAKRLLRAIETDLGSRLAITIKPLEWEPHPAGGEQALAAGLGLYRVHRNGDDWYLVPDYMGIGGKAAAQADYEQRILSAITPNAQLSDAAPDLLDALTDFVFVYGMNNAEAEELRTALGNIIEKAAAAVRKANGR